MAIAFGTSGGASNGTTSCNPAYPASISSGDLLLMSVVTKYSPNGPATPSGWTAPSNNTFTGGVGLVAGADTGTATITIFTKIADGTESGTVAVTVASGNCVAGRIHRYTKASAKQWRVNIVGGTFDTPGTAWSVTLPSNPGINGGDMVIGASAANTDARTYSAEAVSTTGITYGTATERADSGNTSGDQARTVWSDHVVTSGTSSAAPVYTMTASGTTPLLEPAGATAIIVLTESFVMDAAITLADLSASSTATNETHLDSAVTLADLSLSATDTDEDHLDAAITLATVGLSSAVAVALVADSAITLGALTTA